MAEVKTPRYHVDKGSVSGVVKIVGQGRLAEKFIEAVKTFKEALAKARLRDEYQKNSIVIYFAHLDMFEMKEEQEDLINHLIGTCSIGGFNISAAIMDDTGIYTPAGLGIKDSKEHEKAIKELREERNRGGDNRERNN